MWLEIARLCNKFSICTLQKVTTKMQVIQNVLKQGRGYMHRFNPKCSHAGLSILLTVRQSRDYCQVMISYYFTTTYTDDTSHGKKLLDCNSIDIW